MKTMTSMLIPLPSKNQWEFVLYWIVCDGQCWDLLPNQVKKVDQILQTSIPSLLEKNGAFERVQTSDLCLKKAIKTNSLIIY